MNPTNANKMAEKPDEDAICVMATFALEIPDDEAAAVVDTITVSNGWTDLVDDGAWLVVDEEFEEFESSGDITRSRTCISPLFVLSAD